MKPLCKCISVLLISLLSASIQTATAQNIAINTDGSNPDVSAMLDIVSSNKGLLIPRIDLISTTDAATIANPATGLLVYNTRAGITGSGANGTGFYYNSGNSSSPVWTKLVSSDNASYWKSSGNAGIDSTTDFIGTTDGKSFMIKTNNQRRINVSSNGTTTIGDGSNQVKFDPSGHLSLEGSATNFNDITVPPFSTYTSGSNAPLFSAMKNNGSGSRGVQTFTFQDVSASYEQEVFFSIQMPHNWKEGTVIYPHVHWSPQTNTSGAVVWGFEYSWVDYNSTTPVAFPNTSIITATSAAVTGSDVDKHLIAGFSSLTPSGSQGKISSILMCRLFRNSSNASDNYTGNAALLSFDIHYELDGMGSNTLYVK